MSTHGKHSVSHRHTHTHLFQHPYYCDCVCFFLWGGRVVVFQSSSSAALGRFSYLTSRRRAQLKINAPHIGLATTTQFFLELVHLLWVSATNAVKPHTRGSAFPSFLLPPPPRAFSRIIVRVFTIGLVHTGKRESRMC